MTRYQRIPEHGNVAGLFTERHTTYERFIRVVRYQQGIRAFFLESPILRSGLRVLDAGCGTGVITQALRGALIRRQMDVGRIHAFDLTPAMLRRFRLALDSRGIDGVEMLQANVLQMEKLPATWTDYDLIVSASMLEYVPPDQLPNALAGLRERLANDGTLVVFITKRNWLTHPLIGWWWRSNLYSRQELVRAFQAAGFSRVDFARFPLAACYLGLWGYAIEARR